MNRREVILWVGDYAKQGTHPNVLTLLDNKPFLEYVLEIYLSFGFQHAVLVVDDNKQPVVKYFGNKYKDIKLTWVTVNTSLGVVGAIKEGLKNTESNQLLAASATVLSGANIGKFYHQHCKNNYSLSAIVGNQDNCKQEWIIETTVSGRIRNFAKKTFSSKKNLLLNDIYMISKDFLLSPVFETAVSMEKDILELYFKTEDFQVMVSKEHYIDLKLLQNTPEELSIIKKFNFENIISDIEENKSQLELVS